VDYLKAGDKLLQMVTETMLFNAHHTKPPQYYPQSSMLDAKV